MGEARNADSVCLSWKCTCNSIKSLLCIHEVAKLFSTFTDLTGDSLHFDLVGVNKDRDLVDQLLTSSLFFMHIPLLKGVSLQSLINF